MAEVERVTNEVRTEHSDEDYVAQNDSEMELGEQNELDTMSDLGDGETKSVLETIHPSILETENSHPLQNSWTMWYDHQEKAAKASEWTANLNKVLIFDKVEEFRGLYNHIVRASELADLSNYHLFKSHIQPAWEDPENAKGGRWMITYSHKRREQVDADWLYTMLACIGLAFEDESQICGCVVTNRSRGMYRIALWTRDATDVASTRRIGYTLAKLLNLEKRGLEFAIHFAPPKSSPDYDKLRLQYVL